MSKRLFGVIATLIILVALPLSFTFAETDATPPAVLISEFQIHVVAEDGSNTRSEFVELYNPNPEAVDISEWQLHYKPASGGSWSNKIGAGQENMEHIVPAESFYLLATNAFMGANPELEVEWRINGQFAQGGGHLRLVMPDESEVEPGWLVVDQIGWGNADNPWGEAAPAPQPGESLSRCFSATEEETGEVITNSGDNALDFIINQAPLPKGGLECPLAEEPEPIFINDCSGLRLSEIGANLANEEQFIEIHNTTGETVDLTGCQLMTNRSSTKNFTFTEDILAADSYRAIFIQDTELTLTKTTSGTVYLLSSDQTVEVDTQSYANLKTETAWAWFGDTDWRQTYAPTPGAENIWQEFLPCPDNQERNPETGRCRNIQLAESTLTPCGPGQERNPETNRCRAISSGPTLVPCGPGQERNPETNRCRSIAAAGSNLVPCGPNQERNPETNRCRNVVTAGNAVLSDVQDVLAVQTAPPGTWWLAGAALVFASLYGIWEWRYDVWNLLIRLRRRF